MRAAKHKCPARDCCEQVSVRMLLCVAHWRMVPSALLHDYWRAYRNKHRGGRYEGEHRNAVRAVIKAANDAIDRRRERDAQAELGV